MWKSLIGRDYCDMHWDSVCIAKITLILPHCVPQAFPCVFRVLGAELTFSPLPPVLEWVPGVLGQGFLWLVSVVLILVTQAHASAQGQVFTRSSVPQCCHSNVWNPSPAAPSWDLPMAPGATGSGRRSYVVNFSWTVYQMTRVSERALLEAWYEWG